MGMLYRLIALTVLACIAGCGGGGGSGGSSTSPASSVGGTSSGSTNGAVSGVITDSSGAPLANVTVSLSGAGSQTIATDAAGAYVFGGLAAGAYVVTPTSAGTTFTPASVSLTVSGQSAGANFVRTALVLPSTTLISSYAAIAHSQMLATFAADESTLGNQLAAQGLFSSGAHYTRSRTDYLAQVQGFTDGLVAFVQSKAQTMPIDHAAAVSILSSYASQDSGYAETYYGGVGWGLSASALTTFIADTQSSVASISALV
jgi:hypothetical protein